MSKQPRLNPDLLYNTALRYGQPLYHVQGNQYFNPDGSFRPSGADEPAEALEIEDTDVIPAADEITAGLSEKPGGDQGPELILPNSGRGFKTSSVAKMTLARRHLDPGLYHVIPYEKGGFVIARKE